MEPIRECSAADAFSLSTSTPCSRILIVANTLPIHKTENGIAHNPTKTAGIASAVQSLRRAGDIKEFLFIGHTPGFVNQENIAELDNLFCVPVLTPKDVYDSYHDGFCKSSLWPLLHYRLHLVKHNMQAFEDYSKVNSIFAETILKHCRSGDMIWIHDYHLMLLPLLLRQRIPRGVPIGFFYHVPFPSSELFRVLPNRAELLMGVLGSDLIGFHTFEYVRHFESTVSRLLGAECTARGIESLDGGGHFVRVDVFSGGIDYDTFEAVSHQASVVSRIDHLKDLFKGKQVIVSRDRVDEIEGVPLKLLAIEKFLKKYPQWKGKVVHFQIYEPQDIGHESEESKALQKEVNEIVGRLNGAFGTVDYVPIEYVNKILSLEEICALYSVANVALITPIRDGLNLVSHEYVACQQTTNPGVLILSEFTGAARCLAGARLVNPFDTNDLLDALHEALTLSEEDKLVQHEYNFEYVRTNTAQEWAKHFFDEMNVSITQLISHATVPLLDIDMVGCTYSRSVKNRLFLLNYDGALSLMARHPKMAVPSAQVIDVLTELTKDHRNKIYVISGRDGASLESWLGHLDVGLACEHGAYFKSPGAKDWQSLVLNDDTSWRQSVVSIMEDFTDRTPGSFVELKQINVAWHYRNSDPEYGKFQARDLVVALQAIAGKFPVEIIRGKKAIEVKPHSVSKGKIVERILQGTPEHDFVLCIGDDKTDEDMFANFCNSSRLTHFTTCVMTDAKHSTQAKYWVETYNDVLDILSSLVSLDEKKPNSPTHLNNWLLPPVSARQLRRNSLLCYGASSIRGKKKFLPTSLLGSCGIVQQAEHLEVPEAQNSQE